MFTGTHGAVVKQDMAPLIFHTEERDEDDHKEESDHTENNHQTTVSHQERELSECLDVKIVED